MIDRIFKDKKIKYVSPSRFDYRPDRLILETIQSQWEDGLITLTEKQTRMNKILRSYK